VPWSYVNRTTRSTHQIGSCEVCISCENVDYQNHCDVMTRRACIACIISNLFSIKVKWLQKLDKFTY